MDIVQMSLSASVLLVVIVIIRALTLHKLPKKTFLVLWGVVICRLLIPFSIPSRFSIYTGLELAKQLLPDQTATSVSAPLVLTGGANITGAASVIEAAGGATSADTAAAYLSPDIAVWLIGLCACSLFFIITYIKCRKEFRTALPVDNGYINRWLRENRLRRMVQIRQSDRIHAPLTYGVFRPVILLPKTIDWTDEASLKIILTHEMIHIRRFDMLTKLVLTAAVCVHWFNPIVWVMYVLANRDIELACDEAVVRTFGVTIQSAYALTLIGLEEKKSAPAPLISGFSKDAIEERITAIMKTKKYSMPVIVFAVLLVVGLTVGFTTSNVKAVDKVNLQTASPQDDSEISSTDVPNAEPSGDTANMDTTAYSGYPVNQYGWTYGSALMRQTLGLEYDADLMEAIGAKGQSGYIKKVDRELNMPAIPDEYRTIPLFDANINVVGAFVLSYDVSMENGVYISAAQEPSYPRNSKGETYGDDFMCQVMGYQPDLVAALGTEGQNGYIRESEIPGEDVTTLEEAAEHMAYMSTLPPYIMIPLYDQEGNVIGEFPISNSVSGEDFDSWEAAREALEALKNSG
jgi:beta-lactamase regulating signal transducer with metallopeptidase domain